MHKKSPVKPSGVNPSSSKGKEAEIALGDKVKQDMYVTKQEFDDLSKDIEQIKAGLMKLLEMPGPSKILDEDIKPKAEDVRLKPNEDVNINVKLDDGIIRNIYDCIQRYDGEGDIQKLYDFIDKVDSYMRIAKIDDNITIDLITIKLIGNASLWWRHHKQTVSMDSLERIKTWKQLKDMLLKHKITDEHERQTLTQLDILQQKNSIREYNIAFEKLTMQILELPLKIEMHYYLKGLKKEIRQLVESNRENLTDMMTLKLACLRQDQIINPQAEDKKTNDTALMMTNRDGNKDRGNRGNGRGNRGNGRGRGRGRGRGKGRAQGLYQANCLACGEYGHIMMDCPAVKETVEKRKREKLQRSKDDHSAETTYFTTIEKKTDSRLRFILDSGSTSHMTPYKELIVDMKSSTKQIRAAGDSTLDVVGEGKIAAKLGNSNYSMNATVENVLYTPELQESLMSIATINDHGHDIIFRQDGKVWIINS